MRLRAIIARRTRPRQTRQAADSDTRAQFHYPETTRKSPPGHLGSVRARPALVLLLIAIQIPSQMRQVFQTRTNPPAGSGCCGVSALRMINLDVPQTALAGDTIKLSCFYSLTADGDEVGTAADRTRANLSDPTAPGPRPSEMLYAVKWYKEDKEFFRYLAQEWPHKQALPLVGVQVDVSARGRRQSTRNRPSTDSPWALLTNLHLPNRYTNRTTDRLCSSPSRCTQVVFTNAKYPPTPQTS